MLLRELLRSYNWTIIDSTPSVEKAMEAVVRGDANLVIADDTPGSPVLATLRTLLSHPVAITVPTLAFILESNKDELNAIRKLGRPEIVEKPLTPSKFIPGFVNLVKRWEQEPFSTLRRATYHYLEGNDGAAIKTMLKLSERPETKNLCAIALSQNLRWRGKMKEAETALLSALKHAPRDLGTMIALGELYCHAAMPKLALRLFHGARSTFENTLAPLPDMVQAALLKGDVADAVGYLNEMFRAEYLMDRTPIYLARLLYAEGRVADAEKTLSNNKTLFGRLQSEWNAAEDRQMGAAG